jgi:DNA replication protein DnaC
MLKWDMSKNGLCLGGSPGRGKTHLCLALAIRLMRERRDVYFTRPGDVLNKIMALKMNNHVDNINDYQKLLERLKSVEILFLDDLGTENLTDPKKEVIFEILDERTKRKDSARTFITTNLSWPELNEKYHPRFTSRIEEVCSVEIVKGEDFRSVLRVREKRKNS